MDPIVLTEFGEMLRPHPGVDESGITERTVLICWGEVKCGEDAVGIHDVCNGAIQLRMVSATHNALCCNLCNLRIVIPREVDNYGKLRQWCEKRILEAEREIDFKKNMPEGPLFGGGEHNTPHTLPTPDRPIAEHREHIVPPDGPIDDCDCVDQTDSGFEELIE